MTNYQDLIKKNASEFDDPGQLEDFLDAYMSDDKEVSDMEDNLAEYADGLVPIYYNDIVKEWQENGDCHELTLEVAGEYDQKAGIYKMMSSDLYFYYEQKLRQDFDKLLEIIDEAGDEPEAETEEPTN